MYPRPIVMIIIVLLNLVSIGTIMSQPIKNGLSSNIWSEPCGNNLKFRHKRLCSNELNDNFVRYYIQQLSVMSKKYKALCDEYISKLYNNFVYFDPKSFLDQNSTVKSVDFNISTPVEEIQKEFHTQLINQITRLSTLSHLHLKRQHSMKYDIKKRIKVFNEVANDIKGLMCEIEADVKSRNGCKEIDLNINFSEINPSRHSGRSADVTGLMIEDWYFYKNFDNFIENWGKFFQKYAEDKRKKRNFDTKLI